MATYPDLAPLDHPDVRKARAFAIYEHGAAGVLYNGRPFSYHLDAVAFTLIRFGHTTPTELAAAYLHDVVEDCNEHAPVPVPPVTIDQIKRRFGLVIADYVDALTDVKWNPDGTLVGNRRTRQLATYEKARLYAALHGDGPINVKLADRIANMTETLLTRSSHLGMYFGEHRFFSDELRQAGGDPAMWAEVDLLASLCGSILAEQRLEKALKAPINA